MGSGTGAAAWFVIHRNRMLGSDYLSHVSKAVDDDLAERGFSVDIFIVFFCIILVLLPLLCLL